MPMKAITYPVTPEEIGAIITKLALADQGFLVLLLTAAGRAECVLSPEDFNKLAAWGKSVHMLAADAPGNHADH